MKLLSSRNWPFITLLSLCGLGAAQANDDVREVAKFYQQTVGRGEVAKLCDQPVLSNGFREVYMAMSEKMMNHFNSITAKGSPERDRLYANLADVRTEGRKQAAQAIESRGREATCNFTFLESLLEDSKATLPEMLARYPDPIHLQHGGAWPLQRHTPHAVQSGG